MEDPKPFVNMVSDEDARDGARELFEQMKKATGNVPKWMRVMANCEEVLIGFFTLFKATMDDAPLNRLLKWKVALKVSELNKCEYCVDISKMKLKEFGLKDEDIASLHEGMSEEENAALSYAEAANAHAYNIDPKIMDEVKKHFDDAQVVELAAVVGLFNFINRFNDSLGVLPEIPSSGTK